MTHPHLAADEIAANILSIEAVPRAVLPDGAARDALLELAASGMDVYAYASGGETLGTWCAWIDELARRRVDRNGRVTLADWCDSWPQLLTELGEVQP